MRTLSATPTRSALRRDLVLLARMAGMLVVYWTFGARLRRRYRRCEERGRVLFLDAAGKTRHREQAFGR